nr:hypothetical protein [uncultured Clostridium sp.]
MLVTLAGIVIEHKLDCAKASEPIVVTLSGISIVVPLYWQNASCPILVTPLGIIVFVIPKISSLVAISIIPFISLPDSSRLVYTGLLRSTLIEINLP